MKANFTKLHNNNIPPKIKLEHIREKIHSKSTLQQNNINNNINRPAQALSFGGSTISLGQKFAKSTSINNFIKFVDENEAAYNAIYSLIIAGMIKPAAIIAQTKHDKEDGGDKDGIMIATKNFLQAFTGSFLGLTIGGGFVKKIWDNISNHLKLFHIDENNNNITTVGADSKNAKKIAKKILQKEHNSIGNKFTQAKKSFSANTGFSKISGFFKGLFKEIEYNPTNVEINAKASRLVRNFELNHKKIFEKNPQFLKKLVSNIEMLEHNPCSAKKALTRGSQISDAFESVWKNSTGAITTIGKAKISSLLLPTVTAIVVAKRCNDNNKQEQRQEASLLLNSAVYKDTQQKFSKLFNKDNSGSNVQFKGALVEKAIDKTTRIIENLAMSKGGEKCVNAMSKCKQPSARMGDVESWGLTAYWLGSTTISKRIEPERKLGMNINTFLVSLIASISALILDSITNPFVDKVESSYLDEITKITKKAQAEFNKGNNIDTIKNSVKKSVSKLYNADNLVKEIANKNTLKLNEKELKATLEGLAYKYGKQLKKFKSLTLFTLVVRFLVPVFTVNLSKRVKKKMLEWKRNKNNQAQKA